ncbi:hypothetical protein SPBR_07997 [Sporothrix brasiliensis 5110]|uniref:Uncharacterized protein n=1 Tax=Sporothrix brasiliensis 5110 TaxID=1398154 RepID=A0A0C2IRC6_9PEZI|nr:uncharacterized protein SPBR_07997 [Sporothrix brasiliensis 5110]KIH89440.1 hypothetical protein SPBR_07997 [Sporothrix brasiliensis 5110]
MSNSSTSSCPTNLVPVDLPIPHNLTYAVIPGTNASDPWMVDCCHPSPVHVVNTCWEWCQLNGTNEDDVSSDFNACMITSKRNLSQSNGVLIHMSGTTSNSNNRATFAGMALVALTASVVLF